MIIDFFLVFKVFYPILILYADEKYIVTYVIIALNLDNLVVLKEIYECFNIKKSVFYKR